MGSLRVRMWTKPSKPSLKELESQLRKEGFQTHTWSDAPRTRYGDHEHAHTEVRWVLEGRIRIGTKDRVFDLGPGDRLDMPPRTIHWAEVLSDTPVRYLCGEK